jgi:hypothetical protein
MMKRDSNRINANTDEQNASSPEVLGQDIRSIKNNFLRMNKKLLLISVSIAFSCLCKGNSLPRVFVFTDINIDAGDPDDRQSLIHLLWYANELQIEGIVPDRWDARGQEACNMAIDAYEMDFIKYSMIKKHYPTPESIRKKIASNLENSFKLFETAVLNTNSTLYVLIWGNMKSFSEIMLAHPEYINNIRLITIGTGLMLEDDIKYMPKDWEKSKPCEQLNWNGFGRNAIYNNKLFNDLWWVEMNWTYLGMFYGEEPKEMFHKLSKYGNLGSHIKHVVKNESWAQYFRVGDTPSVLYLIDPNHNLNDPTQSCWAGQFLKPFPNAKPNYFTDDKGSQTWDYLNPCKTWENHEFVRDVATKTILIRRTEMYNALIEKLNLLYAQ